MTPFVQSALSPEAFDVWRYIRDGMSHEDAEATVAHLLRDMIFVNDIYQVNMQLVPAQPASGWPEMWHLSIKRRDKKIIRDWRHLQRIKNELVVPEHEGMELFPAESRLVDSANQYHLWVMVDATKRFPLGWQTRFVDDAPYPNTKQRPLP